MQTLPHFAAEMLHWGIQRVPEGSRTAEMKDILELGNRATKLAEDLARGDLSPIDALIETTLISVESKV